jgi:hypothetical protein
MTNKKLFSRKELIEKGYPFGKAFEGIPMGDADVEWKRTNPDIVVYRPKGSGIYDGDNEHFLVFEAPKSDELMAVWNQSSCEGRGDNHLVISSVSLSRLCLKYTSNLVINTITRNEACIH